MLLAIGSCNNLDADFGSWILDAGFYIIALHRLDSTSHSNNEQCTGHRTAYAMLITELNAV
jgi:hypothetical protein